MPDTLDMNNGWQFDCAEFKQFAQEWSFDHVTSPRYPQLNGKGKNTVQTIKCLFSKYE